MKLNAASIALALTGLLVASDLAAQGDDGPCPNVYPAPQVGHFADVIFSNDEDEQMPIRFAVVGKENVDGVTHYWIEVLSVPPAVGAQVIVQMLVPFYPFENSDIAGYIVKMPGQPAQRVPVEMLAALGDTDPGPGWEDQCATAVDLGVERITVPAGAFDARHYRAGGDTPTDVWLADIPFGMVKLFQSGGRMELESYGADAKSSITEKPIDVEIPPRPQER